MTYQEPTMISLVLLFLLLFLLGFSSSIVESKEYCQFEIFNATCELPNELIVIQEARYGRLQMGRCVQRDYGFLGCSANVQDLLDQSCSGQRTCLFNIPTLRDLVQPCPKDLTSYLEASYSCVTVLDQNLVRCNETIFLNTSSSDSSLYLHYVIDADESHGGIPSSVTTSSPSPDGTAPSPAGAALLSPSCPLSFATLRGQKIDLTLYSFGQHRTYDTIANDGLNHLRPCPVSVYIIEEGARRQSIPLCQAKNREQHVHVTNASHVMIYFGGNQQRNSVHKMSGNYLIKIQVVGCPDMNTPLNSWIERIDDRIIIRCNFSMDTWYLTCKGTSWIGTVTNCTEASLAIKDEIIATKKKTFPVGLLIAVLIGIIFGVFLGLVMLFTVYVFRRKMQRHQTSSKFKNGLLDPEEFLLQRKENEENYPRKIYSNHDHHQRSPSTHVYGHVTCPRHSITCRHHSRRRHGDCDAQLLETSCCRCHGNKSSAVQFPTRSLDGDAAENQTNSSRRIKRVQIVAGLSSEFRLPVCPLAPEVGTGLAPFPSNRSCREAEQRINNNINNDFYNVVGINELNLR